MQFLHANSTYRYCNTDRGVAYDRIAICLMFTLKETAGILFVGVNISNARARRTTTIVPLTILCLDDSDRSRAPRETPRNETVKFVDLAAPRTIDSCRTRVNLPVSDIRSNNRNTARREDSPAFLPFFFFPSPPRKPRYCYAIRNETLAPLRIDACNICRAAFPHIDIARGVVRRSETYARTLSQDG